MLRNLNNKSAYLEQLQQSFNLCADTSTRAETSSYPQAEDCTAWYNRGDAFAHLGCYENALDCFNRSLEIQPSHQAAWVFRGVMLIHLNRYEQALASCDQALEIQPDIKEAWIFRGVALHYLGRYKQAYASYDKALGVNRKKKRRFL